MANSELYNKTYSVPSDVLKYIQRVLVSYPQGNGVKRAKFILKNGILTYQELKRLKHDLETMTDKVQYALAGGEKMKSFIDTTLNADRSGVEREKEVKQDMVVDPNLGTKPFQAPELGINEDNFIEGNKLAEYVDRVNEARKKLKKNALAIIVNDDNKFLLLKRGDNKEIWMPNKWSLVGGGVEKGETPEQACKREVKEETGLEIKDFIKTFNVQRNPDSIEYVFAARYDGDSTDIELDTEENSNYGWYDIPEMKFLDVVPNLVDYIQLAFKKYD